MAEKGVKELVNCWKFDDSIRSEINSFGLRKHLFDFGIDSDLSLNEFKVIPKLKEEFHHNRKGLDISLEEGYTEAKENKKLITDYDNHRKQKWTQFLRFLQKNKTIVEEEPDFVTLSPIISDFFNVEESDSTFFAVKYRGVIYLLRNETFDLEEWVDKRTDEQITHTSYLWNFQYLISNKKDSDVKCYRVDRIDFNGNKIIVCYNVSIIDRNGSPVFVKCRPIYKKYMTEENKRLLRNWSDCVIEGAHTLVVGRRYKSTLQELIVREVDKIPSKCRSYWSDSKCFSFVDQSLEFIKSCVGSELELYEFRISSKDKTLSCFRGADNSRHFLPKFYTECDSDDNLKND